MRNVVMVNNVGEYGQVFHEVIETGDRLLFAHGSALEQCLVPIRLIGVGVGEP